ncbi:U24-ctenitoxin-Pn1a like protein [Argiope bruennichi]|uniref:U24-ctenitoxin-Pn1a like protein n=1 Tax=Argiope bruennichi TaxID=94029 RepID=A0A8T0EG09_ARGBR|nr:U24-ctenitoxin-Pn1a like protein [Argiope bruennichi]
MKIVVIILLTCLLPVVLCWRFPGYPGVDCPTARRKMSEDPKRSWMIPKCNPDGTYRDMQCYDIDDPDACMCTYKDGTPITLPGFGINITSCVCPVVVHDRYLLDKEEGFLRCENGGYFKPLQCSEKTKECWCVTKYGNPVTPRSADRKSCDDVAENLGISIYQKQ